MISNFLGTEIQFVLKLLGKNEKERERKKTNECQLLCNCPDNDWIRKIGSYFRFLRSLSYYFELKLRALFFLVLFAVVFREKHLRAQAAPSGRVLV